MTMVNINGNNLYLNKCHTKAKTFKQKWSFEAKFQLCNIFLILWHVQSYLSYEWKKIVLYNIAEYICNGIQTKLLLPYACHCHKLYSS